MMKTKLTLRAVLAAGMMIAGTARGATEYWVATTGSDATGDGSPGNPCLTISNAVAHATTSGDIVTVSNGTYNTTAEITISAAITVRSYGGGVYGGLANARLTKVNGGNAVQCFRMTAAGAVLDGLTIENGRTGGNYNGGGGVYLNADGTLSNCIIRACSNTGGSWGYGGGVAAFGGNPTLVNCEITDNTDQNGGGGFWCYYGVAATFRNCLIARNTASGSGGGVNTGIGGACVIDACTIVKNISNGSGGGIWGNGTTIVRNSIVYDNLNGSISDNTANGGTYSYTCTTAPGLGGTGNTQLDPQFVNLAASNYTLKAWSPCVDTGSNQGWMTGATDLAGNPRITNAVGAAQTVDMGAYEYKPGALACGFAADRTECIAPTQVVFTALVAGTNKTSLQYWWTFGDGNTANGSGRGVVTNTYANPGLYTVSLAVSNAANEGASLTRTDYISAFGPIIYVAINSPSPAVPYASWATAAHTIGDAIDAAQGDVIGDAGLPGIVMLVSNGTYNITGQIVIYEPIIVQGYGNGVAGGLGNASNTIVQRSSGDTRIFALMNSGAVLNGFTIRNGYNADGAGVYITAGQVLNCIIKDNSCGKGGGLYVAGSVLVSNCVITANTATGRGGGGIYVSSPYPTFVNCQITDNACTSSQDDAGGGGSNTEGGSSTFRNCLIARNSVSNGKEGGACFNRGGGYLTFENCTIVSNTAGVGGGIRKRDSDALTLRNSIVYFNAPDNVQNATGADYSYTCTTSPDLGGTGMTNANPQFVNLAAGDYRLLKTSPCIDAGNNQAWMVGAKDLDGRARKLYGQKTGSNSNPVVDMGAYETYIPPKGTVLVLR